MRTNVVPRRNDLFFALEQEFNQFFDGFFNKGLPNAKSAAFPKMSAYEKDGQFVVTAATSGMTGDDLKVEVTPENVLVLSGRMAEEYRSPSDAKVYFQELRTSAFERSMRLPDYIEGDPEATLKDGVLTLRWGVKELPPAEPQPKRIPIKTE